MDQPTLKILRTIKRNRFAAIGAFLSVLSGLLVYLLITPRLYQAKVRLILDEKPGTSISPLGRDLAQAPGDNTKALATEEELIRSKKVLSKAIAVYQRSQDDELANAISLGTVKNKIQTQVVPGTQIIEISFENEDPTTTFALLNLIAKVVVEENSESIRSEARATRQFLEQQIPQRQQQLVSIEAAISQFKQQYNIISLEGSDNSQLSKSIATAEQTAQDLSAQLSQVQARNRELSKVTGKKSTQETYQSTKAGQDPDLISLREKLSDLESQLNLAKESLTEEHPEIQRLLTEKNATELLYQEKLASLSDGQVSSKDSTAATSDDVSQQLSEKLILSDVEQKELREKLLSTRSFISNLENRRQQYPVLEKTLVSLTRQMETASESVELLKQKLDEARIAEAQLVSNLRLIEEAEKPMLPASPNIPSLLLLGTVAAFAFSVGIVLLLEGVDNKLRELDELKSFTELPLLGVIPKLEKSKLIPAAPLLADLYSDPFLLETFRALSKNIQYKTNLESNILIITSAISGEGKSYIASNLAVVSAMSSKKTLLIDADFRRPSIHNIFKLSAKPGLQDMLKSNSEEVSTAAIQHTSIKNLSVITSGKFSYDNLFSLETTAIDNLFNSLSNCYDLIIIDTPPVMACSDALTLSHRSNQSVIVAKIDLTPKDGLRRAIDIFNSNNSNPIGLVINGSTSMNKYYDYLQKDYALAS